MTAQGTEGAFIIGSFWLIENYAKAGRLPEAIELFENVVRLAPAQGLLSEEIDADNKVWLGNYPQAFSHIGLINAALTINELLLKKERP
jgi:GH15 family glucan-1,4-alpha-glucosidase